MPSCVLYDTSAGTFTLGTLIGVINGQSATLLNSGNVLVAGGFSLLGSGSGSAGAELYLPDQNLVETTSSMSVSRVGQTATLLDNGAVLVAGGILGLQEVQLASAELYVQFPFTFFPGDLSFSNQPLGTTSASGRATLINNGLPTALNVTGVTISGTNASDFAETNNCVGSVAPGASCNINVTFTPAATGPRTGSLIIATSLTANSASISLTGNLGAATQIASLSAGSLTFPSQLVGATSPTQEITLSNAGNTPLLISNLYFSGANGGDFPETGNCGGNLAPGASCTLNVAFAPAGPGTRTATLTIMDNATSSPNPQTATLSGVGQDFSVTPTSSPVVTVAPGKTASYSLAIAPLGGFNGSIAFTCSGAPASSTCAASPNPVVLNGSNPATVMVTVSTMAAAFSPAIRPSTWGGYRPLYLVTGLLGLLVLAGLLSRHKDRRPRLAYGLVLLLFLSGGIMMSACGSAGGNGSQPPPESSYTLVVSGTFTSGPTTLKHNSTLSLVLQ